MECTLDNSEFSLNSKDFWQTIKKQKHIKYISKMKYNLLEGNTIKFLSYMLYTYTFIEEVYITTKFVYPKKVFPSKLNFYLHNMFFKLLNYLKNFKLNLKKNMLYITLFSNIK